MKVTYSPVEEIDKYLDLNTSKVLFKKAGNLDVKAAAAAVKKYLDKKYTFKTSIESQSMIKSNEKIIFWEYYLHGFVRNVSGQSS